MDNPHRPNVSVRPSRAQTRRDPPPPPGWARVLLVFVRLIWRLALLALVYSWPLLRLAGRHVWGGWRQLVYLLVDTTPKLTRGVADRSRAAAAAIWRKGLVPFARRGLRPIARALMLPAALVGAVAAGAMLLHHVDAPASPKVARSEADRNAVLATEDPFRQAVPRLDEQKLRDLRGAIVGGDTKARAGALARLKATTRQDAALLHRELLRRTRVPAANYKTVLRRVGAHVPDGRGRFPKARKRKDLDWLAALVDHSAQGRLAKARDEALYSLALMRALVESKRPEVATSLLRFAYRHDGAFRDECGRLLRTLRDHAVPGLVRARLIDDPLAFRIARYAGYQLDRMNRARPELALRRAGSPELRAELLHAYGEARSNAAVRAVVHSTGSLNPRVRRAARWSTLRYASGRKPQARKRRLKLAGGKHTARARSLYYTYRQLVHHQLALLFAKTKAAAAKTPAPTAEQLSKLKTENDARSLAVKLFRLQDARRRERDKARLSKALARASKGELQLAVGTFDRVLSKDPEHPQRAAIAEIYLRAGQRDLRRGRYKKAALAFAKALLLLPRGDARRPKLRALRLLAEARRDGGSSAQWRLQRALALDPSLEQARRQLAKLESREATNTTIAGVSAGLAAAGLLLLLVALRRRRRSAAS
jgi:tetratricopeptide (TPR) repeat protein